MIFLIDTQPWVQELNLRFQFQVLEIDYFFFSKSTDEAGGSAHEPCYLCFAADCKLDVVITCWLVGNKLCSVNAKRSRKAHGCNFWFSREFGLVGITESTWDYEACSRLIWSKAVYLKAQVTGRLLRDDTDKLFLVCGICLQKNSCARSIRSWIRWCASEALFICSQLWYYSHPPTQCFFVKKNFWSRFFVGCSRPHWELSICVSKLLFLLFGWESWAFRCAPKELKTTFAKFGFCSELSSSKIPTDCLCKLAAGKCLLAKRANSISIGHTMTLWPLLRP